MLISRSISLVAIAVLLFGCRPQKKAQQLVISPSDSLQAGTHADSAAYIRNLYRELDASKVRFETFSAKMKVDIISEGKKNEVNAVLRIRRDSAIWLSVNAVLGIEAFRVLITPDSVKILDRMAKTAQIRSLPFLQELIHLPLDYAAVQDLLTGNPVLLDSNITTYTAAQGQVTLLCRGDWFRNLVTITTNPRALVQNCRVEEDAPFSNRSCSVTYNNYEIKENRYFPTYRNILLTEKEKLEIKLDYKQYSFNEALSFPFNVPKNYSSN